MKSRDPFKTLDWRLAPVPGDKLYRLKLSFKEACTYALVDPATLFTILKNARIAHRDLTVGIMDLLILSPRFAEHRGRLIVNGWQPCDAVRRT